MKAQAWAALIALIALCIAVMTPDSSHQLAVQEYCEMREIYEETEGEYGWPNHNPDLEELCRE